MLRIATLLVYLAILPAVFPQADLGTRADGTRIATLAAPGTKAVVLFFVASDCPISNRTFPEMRRLREKFSSEGVTFWYVYPNAGETTAEMAKHQASFDGEGSALLSPGPDLVRLTHAVATPEVSVLKRDRSGAWTPAYTGRIDNRYVSFGHERTEVTEHFAEQAIDAVIAGRMPLAPVGNPVGCAIMNSGASGR